MAGASGGGGANGAGVDDEGDPIGEPGMQIPHTVAGALAPSGQSAPPPTLLEPQDRPSMARPWMRPSLPPPMMPRAADGGGRVKMALQLRHRHLLGEDARHPSGVRVIARGWRDGGRGPSIPMGRAAKKVRKMGLGNEGSGELTRNVASPTLPNACNREARVALLSLALKKRPIRPYLTLRKVALNIVRCRFAGRLRQPNA